MTRREAAAVVLHEFETWLRTERRRSLEIAPLLLAAAAQRHGYSPARRADDSVFFGPAKALR
jgi:hypothetical protein